VNEAVREFMQSGTKLSQGSWLMKFKFTLPQTALSEIEGKRSNHDVINLLLKSKTFRSSFREFYRATSKRPNANRISSSSRDQYAQASNQVATTTRLNGQIINNEINPPEVVLTRDAINMTKLRRKKQQNNKGKENRQLKLSGNVDLGFKQNKQLKRKNGTRKGTKTTTQMTTTTIHPNIILEDFPPNQNHHRHNHYDTHRKQPINSTPYPVTYRPETTASRAYIEKKSTTTARPSFANTTLSEIVTKQLEKVIKKNLFTMISLHSVNKSFQKQRLDNVRQKLSKLTETERLEYLRIKAERKALKNKSINDTSQ
jgi:hypothetical protein